LPIFEEEEPDFEGTCLPYARGLAILLKNFVVLAFEVEYLIVLTRPMYQIDCTI
jgi:hypothetical protein